MTRQLSVDKGIHEINIAAAHFLGVPPCTDRLDRMRREFNLSRVYTTNSIPLSDEIKQLDLVEVTDLAEIFAVVINRLFKKESVSAAFEQR